MSTSSQTGPPPETAVTLRLDPELVAALRARLRDVAGHTITAIMDEVPSYTGTLSGPMGANITRAVQMALAGFLKLASRGSSADPGTPMSSSVEGAYELGHGEARSGRTAEALLAAYRVGARVAWRELATTAVAHGASARTMARFAELVFAYIDQLSAASVHGYADAIASIERGQQRELESLAQALLRGASADELAEAAGRAGWSPPRTLTVVVLPQAQARPMLGLVDARSLHPTGPVPGIADDAGLGVVLVADAGGGARTVLLSHLARRGAVVGPAVPWEQARASYRRAVRGLPLLTDSDGIVDTDARLAELVLTGDPDALAALQARALAPLAAYPGGTGERLAATLRSWLLHQGRRADVAADLYVHPQTVRYRMGQIRDVYGDRLEDPRTVLELVLALAAPSEPGAAGPAGG